MMSMLFDVEAGNGGMTVEDPGAIEIDQNELNILTGRGGPDIREMNADMMKDPSMEAFELSERTAGVRKAGPSGRNTL